MSDDLFHAGRGFPFDHISPSFVNKFLRCPLAALYYKEGRPMVWDPRYAEVGKYTHSILEREYRPDVRAYIPEGGMDDMMRKRHDAAMLGYRRLIKAEPRFRPKAG
ncbi:MAG: hypothetical protein RBR71_14250, partial [Gudongella sp.]|nr:hypothetical protein [Gudongella sp.]